MWILVECKNVYVSTEELTRLHIRIHFSVAQSVAFWRSNTRDSCCLPEAVAGLVEPDDLVGLGVNMYLSYHK